MEEKKIDKSESSEITKKSGPTDQEKVVNIYMSNKIMLTRTLALYVLILGIVAGVFTISAMISGNVFAVLTVFLTISATVTTGLVIITLIIALGILGGFLLVQLIGGIIAIIMSVNQNSQYIETIGVLPFFATVGINFIESWFYVIKK